MPLPTYIGEGGNIESGDDVCDSVRDNPSIFGVAEARDRILCAYGGLGTLTKMCKLGQMVLGAGSRDLLLNFGTPSYAMCLQIDYI